MPKNLTFSYHKQDTGTEITLCINGKAKSSTFLTTEEMKDARKVAKAKEELKYGFV